MRSARDDDRWHFGSCSAISDLSLSRPVCGRVSVNMTTVVAMDRMQLDPQTLRLYDLLEPFLAPWSFLSGLPRFLAFDLPSSPTRHRPGN